MMRLLLICSSVALLSACGEFDQAQTADRYMPDAKPWQGANNAYVSPGWKPGDKAAWENQMRARAQTQNEYVKVN